MLHVQSLCFNMRYLSLLIGLTVLVSCESSVFARQTSLSITSGIVRGIVCLMLSVDLTIVLKSRFEYVLPSESW